MMGHLDVIPSMSVASGLFGYSAGHAFVPLAHILQETCAKLQSATDGEVLVAVTICRADMPGGMLLFGSGHIDNIQKASASAETETAISVGVDIISSALRLLHVERRARRVEAGRGDLGVIGAACGGSDVGGADQRVCGAPTDAVYDGNGVVSAVGAGAAIGDMPSGTAGVVGDAVGGKSPSFVDPPFVAHEAGVSQSEAAGTGRLERAATDSDTVVRTPVQQTLLDDDHSVAFSRGGRTQAMGPQSAVSAAAAPVTGTVADSSRGGSSFASGVSAGGKDTRDFFLSPDFVLPGLTVSPPRIVLPTGRGRGRINPPAPDTLSVSILDDMVKETRAELSHDHREDSFRNRLLEFVGLYKLVVDALVKQKTVHAVARVKVNHTYLQLTPEVSRGATVTFNIRGKAETFVSPAFKKTGIMINNEYLAVILLMKFKRNPFFLWLLGLFSRGALAPKAADDTAAPAASTTQGSKKKKGKKRQRGSPGSPPMVGDNGTRSSETGRGGQGGLAAASRSGGASGDGSGAVAGAGNAAPVGSGGRRSCMAGGSSRGTGTGGGDLGGGGFPVSQNGQGGSVSGGLEVAGVEGADLGAHRAARGGSGGGGAGTPAESTPCANDEAKALVERVGTGTLLIGGQRVAIAEVHPEFSLFHLVEAPPTVLTAFITCIVPGNENAIYPLGQDQRLCLEKGYPSPTPVPLSAIQAGNRVAWPVGSIGYVACVSIFFLSSA